MNLTHKMLARMKPVFEDRGGKVFIVGYERLKESRKMGVMLLREPQEVRSRTDLRPPLTPANEWRESNWRLNVYICENKHLTTSVDVDKGVTPFIMNCPTCKRPARSACYPRERPIPHGIPAPTVEWYLPNIGDLTHPAEIEHVRKGGLLPRNRTDKTPVCHENPPSEKAPSNPAS